MSAHESWIHRLRAWGAVVAFAAASLFAPGFFSQADGADEVEPPTPTKVPEAAALKKADQLVENVFGDRLKHAKSSTERSAIGEEMIAETASGSEDTTGLYALLESARRIGVDEDDPELAFSAAAKIEERFQVGPLAISAKTASELARHVRSTEKARAMVPPFYRIVDAAVAHDHYDIAKAVCDAIAIASKTSGDASLLREASDKKNEVTEVERAMAQTADATRKLEASPLDAQANTTVGTFRCFYKKDWTQGLPLLAIGGNQAVKDLAEKDLAQPESGDGQLTLGDSWQAFAAKHSGITRRAAFDRAAFWYRKATSSLSGLPLLNAKKKLVDALKAGGDPGAGAREQLAQLVVGKFKASSYGPWTITYDGKDFHIAEPGAGVESCDWAVANNFLWFLWGKAGANGVMVLRIEPGNKLNLSWYGGLAPRGIIPTKIIASWSQPITRVADDQK